MLKFRAVKLFYQLADLDSSLWAPKYSSKGIFVTFWKGPLDHVNTLLSMACFTFPWIPAIYSLWPPSLPRWHPQSPVTADLASQNRCSLLESWAWLRCSVQRICRLVCAAHPGWHRSPPRQEPCLLWEMCTNSSYHFASLMSQKFKYESEFMQSRLSRRLYQNLYLLHENLKRLVHSFQSQVTTRLWD